MVVGGDKALAQLISFDEGVRHVKDFSIAIDGGAHQGDWAAAMSELFDYVYAYEPALDMFDVLLARFSYYENVVLRQQALWSESTKVKLVPNPKSATKTYGRYVEPGGDLEAIAIDDLDLPSCGLIKLDLEGGEMHALRGAQKTLVRCKPVLIIECKEKYRARYNETVEAPGQFVMALGAREVFRSEPDRVYTWE